MTTEARVEGRDLRLFVPAVSGWAACALAVWLRPDSWWIAAGLALAAGTWWVARFPPARRLRVVLSPLLVSMALLGAVQLEQARREPPELRAVSETTVEVHLQLTQTYHPGQRSVRADIVAVDGSTIAPAPARIIGVLGGERLAPGSTASFEAYLQPAQTYESQAWVVVVRGDPPEWVPPKGILASLDRVRAGFAEASLVRTGDAGELLPGLAIGDTSAVDDGLVQAMRVTALSHLVAVSGANCAVVVALVVGLTRLLRGGARTQMATGVAALVGFVALVTPEPSILRASVMAGVVLVSLAWSRPIRGMPVLAIAVIALLAINPWFATDFAFVLSVLATGGILLLTAPLARVISRVMPHSIAVVIALPLAAQVACQPVIILLNPAIPTWGVLANVLAAPAAPVATVLGMLACVVLPVAPVIGQAFVWLAWIPASYIAAIGRGLAEWPLNQIPWPAGWWGVASLATVGYCVIALVALAPPRSKRVVLVLGSGALLALVGVIAGFAVPRTLTWVSVPREWTLAQCDVGQGDALVVRSADSTMLVDTGRYPRALERCLDLLGVRTLDVVLITHFDDDHVGAWRSVISKTNRVVIGSPDDPRKADFVADFSRAGWTIEEVARGHTVRLGEYLIEVIWPESSATTTAGNDSSIVVALQPLPGCNGCVSAVLLGDLGELPQRILLGRAELGGVDVVKVSHHGSADQHSELYRALGAPIALIGVGADNSYGHPAAGILAVLSEHSRVWRSDERGTVTIYRDLDRGLVVWSER